MTVRRAKCPYDLGPAGTAWWRWAWKTPAAQHWDNGALYIAARRAQLEDDHALCAVAGDEDLLIELLRGAEDEAIRQVNYAMERLAASATKTTALSREMRELENQLGLTPKATAGLGWKDDAPKKKTDGLDELTDRRKARRTGAPGTQSSGRS